MLSRKRLFDGEFADTLSLDEVKSVRLTKYSLYVVLATALFGMIVSVVTVPLSITVLALGAQLLSLLGYLVSLRCLKIGRTTAAKMVLCITAALHISGLIAVYGPEVMLELFFVTLMVVAFAILSRSERRLVPVVAAVAGLGLLASVTYYHGFGGVSLSEYGGGGLPEGRLIWYKLSNGIAFVAATGAILAYMRGINFAAEDALSRERNRSEALLLNVLPESVVGRLKQGEEPIADAFDSATVLFADIVNFTGLASRIPAGELVQTLDAIFGQFDELADRWQLEKIKTIGDAYMVVGGVPTQTHAHADAVAGMGLEMQRVMARAQYAEANLDIRIGIHTGPLVAGVIGRRKFLYDLWGDTVNVANRMESSGVPGEIVVSQATRDQLSDAYAFEKRETVDIKGKGPMVTYFLRARTG